MFENFWEMFWWNVLFNINGDGLQTFLVLCWATVFIGVVPLYIGEDKEEKKAILKFLRVLVPLSFVLSVVSFILPTKDDIPFILGGAIVLSASENEEINKLPDNLARAANQFLEEYSGDKE
jgi:hypothetical protein